MANINYDMCILIINDIHIYLVNCLTFLLVSYVPGGGGTLNLVSRRTVKTVKKATWLKITGHVLIELTHVLINALTFKNTPLKTCYLKIRGGAPFLPPPPPPPPPPSPPPPPPLTPNRPGENQIMI